MSMDGFCRALDDVIAVATGQPRAPAAPPHSAHEQFATRFALPPEVLTFLWSVIAMTYDPRLAQLGLGNRMSLALHARLYGLSTSEVQLLVEHLLSDDSVARRWGVLAVDDAAPSVSSAWHTPYDVVAALQGRPPIDDAPLQSQPHLSSAQAEQLESLQVMFGRIEHAPVTLLITGQPGTGRTTACRLASAPRHTHTVDYATVAPAQLTTTVMRQLRWAWHHARLPIMQHLDAHATRSAELAWLTRHYPAALFVTTTTRLPLDTPRPVLQHVWPPPDVPTRQAHWEALLANHPSFDVSHAASLASRYALGPGGIARALAHASYAASEISPAHVARGIQTTVGAQLEGLATHIEVTQTFDDLVLPDDTREDLHYLMARVSQAPRVLDQWGFRSKLPRGSGVAALFSGLPGTGKTMAAGLLAKHFGLELYQVDLANIVSKWVGETEKQLSKLFDAAEAGHILLLFDEADALFGKRSGEVRNATDRYANLEVNYLLQRIESFGGFVVLTTNFDTAIDPALRRRLAASIVFAEPDTAERAKLWQTMLCKDVAAVLAETPDWRKLADETRGMTGANIRNAALASAFLAADEGRAIELRHIKQAIGTEFRAMGRMLARPRSSL